MKALICILLTGVSGVALAEQNPALGRQPDPGYSRLADAVNQLATAQSLADQGADAEALAPALVRYLASPNRHVRDWAEITLVQMGPKCGPAVSQALRSSKPDVRAAAQRILNRVEELALAKLEADGPSFHQR